jgi:hypothetical protein
MTDLASRIAPAAFAAWGHPPELGGSYVETVMREIDIPAYFRAVSILALEPRTPELRHRHRAMFDQDAAFILEGGMGHLLRGDLTDGDRAMIEAIRSLGEWSLSDEF